MPFARCSPWQHPRLGVRVLICARCSARALARFDPLLRSLPGGSSRVSRSLVGRLSDRVLRPFQPGYPHLAASALSHTFVYSGLVGSATTCCVMLANARGIPLGSADCSGVALDPLLTQSQGSPGPRCCYMSNPRVVCCALCRRASDCAALW
jgi:hypothetical protein